LNAQQGKKLPILADPNLAVQVVTTGIDRPTSMAFLGTDDLLVLEQYNGTVLRIKDGKIMPAPLLDVNVGNTSEQGMLGVEVMPQSSGHPYVFLYFTETATRDGGEILGNRLYRYTFTDDANGGKLTNRTLLLDLPAISDAPTTVWPLNVNGSHQGGKITIGPDGNIYLTIGDVRHKTKAQNFLHGTNVDGTGGILRVTPSGETVGNGIIGSTHPLNKYFAYGIRNSFGIDFDPLTGSLWDTENAPNNFDEINLVQPGFNSGWQSVMGFMDNRTPPQFGPGRLLWMISSHIQEAVRGVILGNDTIIERQSQVARQQLEDYPIYIGLTSFNGNETYSDPEFVWNVTIGPTAIQFFNSTMYGDQYLNRMFVAEWLTGKVLYFTLNGTRTGLVLDGELSDHLANTRDETDPILFGKRFGQITDIKDSPDGLLYFSDWTSGTIYKIVTK
jgi:glucose/arabinose dehydrogenase